MKVDFFGSRKFLKDEMLQNPNFDVFEKKMDIFGSFMIPHFVNSLCLKTAFIKLDISIDRKKILK